MGVEVFYSFSVNIQRTFLIYPLSFLFIVYYNHFQDQPRITSVKWIAFHRNKGLAIKTFVLGLSNFICFINSVSAQHNS